MARSDESRELTLDELADRVIEWQQKFGPFAFGEPAFGDWPTDPAAPAAPDAGQGGGGMMPGGVGMNPDGLRSIRVHAWRSSGRVRLSGRARRHASGPTDPIALAHLTSRVNDIEALFFQLAVRPGTSVELTREFGTGRITRATTRVIDSAINRDE